LKKRPEQNQNRQHVGNIIVAPVSTKEANGRQFRFDDKKVAAPYMQSTKLKNFLVGNNTKKSPDPIANKREGARRINELLPVHNNSNDRIAY